MSSWGGEESRNRGVEELRRWGIEEARTIPGLFQHIAYPHKHTCTDLSHCNLHRHRSTMWKHYSITSNCLVISFRPFKSRPFVRHCRVVLQTTSLRIHNIFYYTSHVKTTNPRKLSGNITFTASCSNAYSNLALNDKWIIFCTQIKLIQNTHYDNYDATMDASNSNSGMEPKCTAHTQHSGMLSGSSFLQLLRLQMQHNNIVKIVLQKTFLCHVSLEFTQIRFSQLFHNSNVLLSITFCWVEILQATNLVKLNTDWIKSYCNKKLEDELSCHLMQ